MSMSFEATSDLKTGKRPQQLPPRVFKPGDILCEEGAKGNEMFIILEGKVGIYKSTLNGESELATVGPGGIIGEMSLLDNLPRSATVKALETTKCSVVTQLIFHQTLQKLPGWFTTIIKIIVSRLRDVNKRIDQTVLRDKERGIVSLMLLLFPEYKYEFSGSVALSYDLMLVEGYYVCRLKKNEIINLLNSMQKRGIISIIEDNEHKKHVVIEDIEVLKLFEEFLILRSQKKKFRESSINENLIATLSNIAYVAQKSGVETEEGTVLSKSVLFADLAEKKAENIERDLLELRRKNILNIIVAENGDTSIVFRKEVIGRIKKIKEWVPKFEMKVE